MGKQELSKQLIELIKCKKCNRREWDNYEGQEEAFKQIVKYSNATEKLLGEMGDPILQWSGGFLQRY